MCTVMQAVQGMASVITETTINAPESCYFIHGVKNWKQNHSIGIYTPEISCSLQKDSHTMPIRHYGFILDLDKDALIAAFDTDVTSCYVNGTFQKGFSPQTENKNFRQYTEFELELLISNTPLGYHNELWINSVKVTIIGAYLIDTDEPIPGKKQFLKACRKAGLKVHLVKPMN